MGMNDIRGLFYVDYRSQLETVALLCSKDIDNHIEVNMELDEEDITKTESKGAKLQF